MHSVGPALHGPALVQRDRRKSNEWWRTPSERQRTGHNWKFPMRLPCVPHASRPVATGVWGGGGGHVPPSISKIVWTFLDPSQGRRSITCMCPPPPPPPDIKLWLRPCMRPFCVNWPLHTVHAVLTYVRIRSVYQQVRRYGGNCPWGVVVLGDDPPGGNIPGGNCHLGVVFRGEFSGGWLPRGQLS